MITNASLSWRRSYRSLSSNMNNLISSMMYDRLTTPLSFSTTTATSIMTSSSNHPVIDVSPLLEPPPPTPPPPSSSPDETPNTPPSTTRSSTISQIKKALTTRGYFYARNVPILSPTYISSIYSYSQRLHSLPLPIKQQYSQIDGHGAYAGMDIGQAELPYEKNTTASVHAWDYSRTRFTLTKNDGSGANRYPGKDVIDPDYVAVLDDLYERQNVLGRALMGAFAECLGLEPRRFVNMFDGMRDDDASRNDDDDGDGDGGGGGKGDFGTIRLLRYPGMDSDLAAKATVGISAHTDFEAFTLMHQSAPGLQFLPPDHRTPSSSSSAPRWVDAPVRPGEFVVIIGDALERVTNGILKATPHRVVKTAHPRWSIIRFNAFSSDTVLEPMEEFVTDERPAAYAPVTMGVHMETTMRNLEKGLRAWDEERGVSSTATYEYVDGKDWRLVEGE